MSSPHYTLDPSIVERLDRLAILARQRRPGSGAGPRRSPAAGSSVEFADYRTYARGDDYRRIDWNVFARVNRLFLRIFEAEQNSTLTLFVDCSTSMAGGAPAKNTLARQIACALAFVALVNYDRVSVVGIGERLGPYLPPRSGTGRRRKSGNSSPTCPPPGQPIWAACEHTRAIRPRPASPSCSAICSPIATGNPACERCRAPASRM